MIRAARATTLVAPVVLAVLLGTACGSGGGAAEVTASAELRGEAPFTVEATDPGTVTGDDVEHEIVFTAEGERAVIVGDVRWTFGELTDSNAFATAGLGCSPEIKRIEGEGRIVHACSEEFRILEVRPGEPLRETVTVSGSLGGPPIAEGTFTFEQPLRWWFAEGDGAPVDVPSGEPDGEATVRVTYEVTRSG